MTLRVWNSLQFHSQNWALANCSRSSGTGQNGYASFRSTAGVTAFASYGFTALTHLIVGFCYQHTSIANKTFFVLQSTGGQASQAEFSLRCDSTGAIEAMRSNETVSLGTSASGVLQSNIQNWVEVRVLASTSVGQVEVRTNGNPAPVLNLTGVNTGAATFNMFELVGGASGTRDFSAPYMVEVDASAPSNFLGHIRYGVLTPTANGSNSSWLGSDGNSTDNYLLVDDPAIDHDSDSTYVTAAAVNAKDTYALSSLPTTALSIVAACPLIIAKKGDAGSRAIKPVVRSNNTDYDQTEAFLGTSYSVVQEALLTDPATASAWTESGVNAMEVGQKVST